MNADWKVGDRALCVDDSPSAWTGEMLLSRGTIYLVGGVYLGADPSGIYDVCLDVGVHATIRGHRGWDAARFRKIVPACDRVATEQKQEATQ